MNDVAVKLEAPKPANLTQIDPTLKNLMVGVGWDLKKVEGDDMDLDCSLFLLNHKDQTRNDEDFVFYNNMNGAGGVVQHTGDNRTGIGEGDDETMFIHLAEMPLDISKIEFVISIYDAFQRRQNFSHVRNIFLRFLNQQNGIQLYRIDLDDDLRDEKTTAIIVGVLNREGSNWIFNPTLEKFTEGLGAIAKQRGIVLAE